LLKLRIELHKPTHISRTKVGILIMYRIAYYQSEMSLSRTAHCPARVSGIRYAQLYIGFGISARGIHSDVGFMPQPNLLTGFNPAYKSATLLH